MPMRRNRIIRQTPRPVATNRTVSNARCRSNCSKSRSRNTGRSCASSCSRSSSSLAGDVSTGPVPATTSLSRSSLVIAGADGYDAAGRRFHRRVGSDARRMALGIGAHVSSSGSTLTTWRSVLGLVTTARHPRTKWTGFGGRFGSEHVGGLAGIRTWVGLRDMRQYVIRRRWLW